MNEVQASDRQAATGVDRPGRLQALADRIDRRSASGTPLAGRDPRLRRALVYLLVAIVSGGLLLHAWSTSVAAVQATAAGEPVEAPGLFPLYGYVACGCAVLLSKLFGLVFGRAVQEERGGDAR